MYKFIQSVSRWLIYKTFCFSFTFARFWVLLLDSSNRQIQFDMYDQKGFQVIVWRQISRAIRQTVLSLISAVKRATYRLNNVMRVSAKRSRPCARVRRGNVIVVRRRRLSGLGRVSGRVVGELVGRVVTLVQAVVGAAVAQRAFFCTARQLSIG